MPGRVRPVVVFILSPIIDVLGLRVKPVGPLKLEIDALGDLVNPLGLLVSPPPRMPLIAGIEELGERPGPS